MKRTKIIATLGPATHTEAVISELMQKGMDAVRLNFSHGSYDDHAALMQMVRAAATKLNKHVAIIQDLQGPKIRLGKLPEVGVEIKDNEEVIFDTGRDEYADGVFPVDFKELHKSVKTGDRLLLNDGRVSTKILEINGTHITAQVLHGGLLSSHKGINVPDSTIASSSLTPKDRADAEFGLKQNVDYIALSFVRKPEDVQELREIISAHEGKVEFPTKIIAKMERPEAITNMQAIVEAVDVVMVARGDLGIETSAANVPVLQKQLIAAALLAQKPVIVATQMLDSMQNSPQPTRAEVSDVANAVIDETDCVMLSNETATGQFPLETVAMMAEIITDTENSPFDDLTPPDPRQNTDSLAAEVGHAAEETGAIIIITATHDGEIARHISHFRPQVPIVVVTENDRVARQLSLVSGVYPVLGSTASEETAVALAREYVLSTNMAKAGDQAVVALGHDQQISIVEIKAV